MHDSPNQAGLDLPFRHLLLYDGICGLCNRLVHFVLRYDRRGVFAFASLQSSVGVEILQRFGAQDTELTSFYVLSNYGGKNPQAFGKSRAALFVAAELGWPWQAAVLMRILPSAMLDRIYGLIAHTRYRLFGRFEHCLAPRPEFRGRFLEG